MRKVVLQSLLVDQFQPREVLLVHVVLDGLVELLARFVDVTVVGYRSRGRENRLTVVDDSEAGFGQFGRGRRMVAGARRIGRPVVLRRFLLCAGLLTFRPAFLRRLLGVAA